MSFIFNIQRNTIIKYVFVFTTCLIFVGCNINKHLKPDEYLVEKNHIKYNGTAIDHSELEQFLRQKPNRKILKLVPFNLWLYFQVNQQKMIAYKAKRNLKFDRINDKRLKKIEIKNKRRLSKGKSTKLPKLKNKEKLTFRESILDAGEAPTLIDASLTKITVSQLQKFVFSRGYFNSTVTDSVVLNQKTKRAKYFIVLLNLFLIK